jgi:hypothetical protein
MRPSFRVLFLIVAVSLVLHVSALNTLVILIGYAIAENVDHRLAKREREKWIEGELDGWKQSTDYAEYEDKGNLTRLKLTGQNQIIAARVAQLLRGI